MRICLIPVLLLSLVSCSQNSVSNQNLNASEQKTKRQIIAVAEKYILSQLPDASKTKTKNGLIIIGDTLKKYIVDPSRIYTGLIDDDQKDDAIISIAVIQGQYETMSEQLIILRSGKKFTLSRALESDMKIISIKDRVITADVPEHSRNNPLFNCPSCWEVVKFRFDKGELRKIE